jgi:hypothetical protein
MMRRAQQVGPHSEAVLESALQVLLATPLGDSVAVAAAAVDCGVNDCHFDTSSHFRVARHPTLVLFRAGPAQSQPDCLLTMYHCTSVPVHACRLLLLGLITRLFLLNFSRFVAHPTEVILQRR